MLDLNALRREMLESGDDDYTGLWEAIGMVRSKDSTLDDVRARRIATAELVSLFNSGLLEIYRGTRFSGEQVLVDDIDLALKHDESWTGEGPTREEHYRFAITPKGIDVLRRT